MHIHAQTQVELDRKAVRVRSGSDEHAAIAISITNLITTSITNSITTSIAMSTPPSSMLGAIGMWIEKKRATVVPYIRWSVKTFAFVDLDVRGTVKTRGLMDPSAGWWGESNRALRRSRALKF